MKKILLPTDFSAPAWTAISYAMQLFKEEPCEFFLLHTYVPAFYRVDYALGGPAASGIEDAMLLATIEGLKHTAERIAKEFPNSKHTVHQSYAFSLLTDEIRDICRRESIDLIVMGTKGATGAARILFGSNAVSVIRRAEVPVLLIPFEYTFKPFTKVLFPSDYRRKHQKKELQPLLDLITSGDSTIDIVHVEEGNALTESQESNREALRDCLRDLRVDFRELKEGVMPDAVREQLQKETYSLLVMVNRKHSFLERVLLEQNIDSLGFEIHVPFLVLPATSHE